MRIPAASSKLQVRIILTTLTLFLMTSSQATSAPVIEQQDRLEINWSKMQIRFYGESMTSGSNGENTFKPAETRAWQDGLNYILTSVRDLNRDRNIQTNTSGTSDSETAALNVSRSTFSYNTTYFSSGLVRVYLENRLSRALGLGTVNFRHSAPVPTTGIEFTGIVMKTDRSISPRATYTIVDETGTKLFGVEDMAEDAYGRNLMGRWFHKPTRGELTGAVGEKPIEINVIANDLGEFIVQREQWDLALVGYLPLLVNGQIAVALP